MSEDERLARLAFDVYWADTPDYARNDWNKDAEADWLGPVGAVADEVRRIDRAKVAALVEAAEQEAAASHQCDFEMLSYLDGLRAALAALEEQP